MVLKLMMRLKPQDLCLFLPLGWRVCSNDRVSLLDGHFCLFFPLQDTFIALSSVDVAFHRRYGFTRYRQ